MQREKETEKRDNIGSYINGTSALSIVSQECEARYLSSLFPSLWKEEGITDAPDDVSSDSQ